MNYENEFDDIFKAFEEGVTKKEEENKMTNKTDFIKLSELYKEANEELLARKAELDDLKALVKKSMEEEELDTVKTPYAVFSIKAEYETVGVDRKKLETNFPRVFEQVKKFSKTKESLAVKVNK